MNHHVIIIIFGITGDLAKRKLIPALYHVFRTQSSNSMSIIGVSNQEASIHAVVENAKIYVEDYEELSWYEYKRIFHFCRTNIDNEHEMLLLAEFVKAYERPIVINNKIIYFAVPPTLFGKTTMLLAKTGMLHTLSRSYEQWVRVVYEKPFGNNVQSAHQLNTTIRTYLDESQICRIDHYLTKEIINNIPLIRFSNMIFEPLWNNHSIEQVHIVLNETGGIENRGSYYDSYGILKDVVQNHMLQTMALLTMEMPASIHGNALRLKRFDVLKEFTCDDGILGQYIGYKKESHVAPFSQTPTFALLKFSVNNQRWEGVPFFLHSGKRLAEHEVAVHIKFKSTPCLSNREYPTLKNNWLTLGIGPRAFCNLTINMKNPHAHNTTTIPIHLFFDHDKQFSLRHSHAYERIFEDIIAGKNENNVHADEINIMWKIIESIESQEHPVHVYEQYTHGPAQHIHRFVKEYNMSWWPHNSKGL